MTVGELAKISKISVKEFFMKDDEAQSLPKDLFREKIKLLGKIDFYIDNRVAVLFVSKEEEEKFSEAGHDSPGHLIRPEIRRISGVELCVILTEQEDGSIRGSARSKGTKAAVEVARRFGGGGHDQAAGFMVDGMTGEALKKELIEYAQKILVDEK